MLTLTAPRACASIPSATRRWIEASWAATRTAGWLRSAQRIIGDTGAYASVGAKVLERAAGHACGAVSRGQRRRRGARRLHQQSAVRSHARLRRAAGHLRPGGPARRARRARRRRRLGDSLAQRARRRRPLRHRPAARPGSRAEGDPAGGPRRVSVGALRGHRLRRQEHGHRQRRWWSSGRAILASGGGRHADPAATRGPRWARASTPRCARSRAEELGIAGRADQGRGRHRARARHRRDDRLARDAARRPGRPAPRRRPCARRSRDGQLGGPGGPRVRGRLQRRLDDPARRRPAGADDPYRLRLGHPGRDPRRRRAAGTRRRRPGRGARDQPAGRWRARSRAACTWASATR